MLSKEELRERYGAMQPLERIKAMIDDNVDTDIIMQVVRTFSAKRFEDGRNDAYSRVANRPGDGDMGG